MFQSGQRSGTTDGTVIPTISHSSTGIMRTPSAPKTSAASPDKPDVVFAPPADARAVSHEMTIRVPNCHAAYEALQARGARFLTPPVESPWEVRCFFRDPDGHLLEISEARSV